ncbi:MAG: AI-2E family transporter [Clostridia bacterium]|nr:AI-2E family transporter [Clostridia bacterium]
MKKIKIPYLNVLPVLFIAFLLFKLVNNTELSFGGVFQTLYSCIAYFVSGFVVAYLLNPAMNFFEKLIASTKDSAQTRNIKRTGVIAFLYLLLIGCVTIFVVAIIPIISNGFRELADKIPSVMVALEEWVSDFGSKTGSKVLVSESWFEDGFKILYNWLRDHDFSTIGGAVTSGVSSVATGLIRFGFGLVISVYFLYSKERIILSIKKFCFAVFGKNRGERIVETGQKINTIFMNFIVSRLLQSLIMFLLGLLVLVPIRVPLAPLIALFIAAMNMIPYFGPFLGGLISVVLVLFYSPVMALWVLIYAVGIQVLDNVVIGPKIVSEQMGISPVLVILGVTLGGIFGGVLGMILGVPLVAVVKLVFYDAYIDRKLKDEGVEF